jgi:hypothetical protein
MTCSGGRAPSRSLDPRRPEPNVVMKRTRVWRRNLAHSPPDCLHRNVMRDIASDRRYLTSAILIAEHESLRHAAEVMNFSHDTQPPNPATGTQVRDTLFERNPAGAHQALAAERFKARSRGRRAAALRENGSAASELRCRCAWLHHGSVLDPPDTRLWRD